MSITTRSPRNFKFSSNDTSPNVGPGSYNIPGSIQVAKESPFPFNTTAARNWGTTNDNPGPSDYHPEIPKIQIAISAGMKSRSPRQCFEISHNPSPADHAPIEQWRANKAFSPRAPMSSRSPRTSFKGDTQYSVGPGDLDIRFPMNKGPKIPKSGRSQQKFNTNPGPGKYDISEKEPLSPRQKSAVFMSEQKREIYNIPDWIADYPGLSQNEWKKPKKGHAPFGSNARKSHFWRINKTPGPGTYEGDVVRKVEKSQAAFGSTTDRNIFKSTSDTPGPGAYKIEKRRKLKEKKESPFGQRSERFPSYKSQYDAAVGLYDVGKYDEIQRLHKQEGESRAFKNGSDRNPFPVNTKVPGAGAYSPEKARSSHRLKICIDGTDRTKPGTFIGQPIVKTPSPGDYEQDVQPMPGKSDTRVRIRSSRRQGLGRETDAPSPDKYNLGTSLVKPSYNVTYSLAKM